MAVEQRRAGLKVEIPKDESPRLGRVGLIAVVGFAIGAVWPSLANFKLVPNAPSQPAAAPGLAGEPVAASAMSALPSAAPPPPEAPAAPAGGAVVGELQVTSCRGEGGRKVETCDAIDFDRVARPRLQALAGCAGASRLTGMLSVGLELDFEKGKVVRVASGKSTTLGQSETDALIDCANTGFADVNLEGIAHQHAQYTAFYRVEFTAAPEAPAEEAEPVAADQVSVTPATGRATVSWEVALVRSGPSRDGKVVARVLSGTRVVVTGRNGDWYQIKYDAKGNQGWVYRTAIGM